MNSFFDELGRTVLTRWKKENFSLARFPEIARGALEQRPPSGSVDLSALAREFLLDDEQPFQTQSGFGQPELVVFDDPRFYIQVLFWLEGTTDIHQHEFSGAFHVLAGSSIHADFHFENVRPVSAHFRLGDLRMRGIELLETGSTAPIISGRDHIHSLFHLDTPSISVVIRTRHDPGTGPQFTYLPPHVALDPVQEDALTARRKQLLDVLERTADPAYPELVYTMLGELDFERGFFILQNGMGHLLTLGAWEGALRVFQTRHGELADGIAPTLDEIVRRDALVAMRASVTEAEHRFFLALLLNASNRADTLRLVSLRFPGPPEETILRWAEELIETSEFSTWLLDAEFPEDLPVPPGKRPEIFLAALRQFLKAGKNRARRLSPEIIEALRASLLRSSLRPLVV